MMTVLITTSNSANKIFSTVAAAEKVASDLGRDDDSTIYEVRHDPSGSGRALIAIIDREDGFLGYL